jgi:CheY-like chemotaxis protein
MNLIINAAEAIGDDYGTITVVLSRTVIEQEHAERDVLGTSILPGMYVTLMVQDTGCGMDEMTQKRIFEPFFTTKLSGRGLGMAAICGIIKSHAGILQLVSTQGGGTTFTVSFPVMPKAFEETVAPLEALPLKKAGGTVLLVDDEEILLSMGETLLEALGFSVITARNGCEAFDVFSSRGSEIDIVLMDLIMPVKGGIEAYHEMRSISRNLPIIICSGYDEESVKDIIADDPHAGFVHKPYNPKELRCIIFTMVEYCKRSRA